MYFILYIHIAGVDHRSTHISETMYRRSLNQLNCVPHAVFVSTVECGNQTSTRHQEAIPGNKYNNITRPSNHSREPAVLLRLSHKARNKYLVSFADMPILLMYSATFGSEGWRGPHCVQFRF